MLAMGIPIRSHSAARASRSVLLTLVLAACGCVPGTAWAATPQAGGTEVGTDARVYAIRPGPLAHALDVLATQGGVQVAYAPELVAGKASHGLTGRFTPDQALRHLLAGSGLQMQALGPASFVLMAMPRTAAQKVPVTPLRPSSAAAATLATVNVSGALIGSTGVQTATPVFTITAAQIQARGFGSVAEVLRNNVFATGSVQGPQESGAFTQGAQPISLFGLGPQFTLILVDGKPVASYGRPYNGSHNFISVANLPLSLIDHIDVMAGGGSAIYGSQAIGGVINIVTRAHLDGGSASVQLGGYPAGGGASQRMTLAWGRDSGRLHALAALEFANAEPIWGYQRALTARARGSDAQPPMTASILDYGTLSTFDGYPHAYVSPPTGCDSRLYGGRTQQAGSPASGRYCGSAARDGYRTYSNDTRSYDGLLKLRYRASDALRLYADAMWNLQQQRWYPGVPGWSSDDLPGSLIEDADNGHILYPQRYFAPEEMPGGAFGQMYRQRDLLYQADLGANGRFGATDWTWDLYHLRSGDHARVREPLLIAPAVDAYFNGVLGATGSVDPQTGLALYRPDYAAFFTGVPPAAYAGFTRGVEESSRSDLHATRLTVGNTAWFALPGGHASVAALVEAGGESWHEPVNPLFTDGLVFEHAASGGGGRRNHAAAAFELNLPLLKPLTLDLSGREDRYASAHGEHSHHFTWRLGLEYRPLRQLLLRANYATSFKAPDLSSLYLAPSGYYTQITDYYACARDDAPSCAPYSYGVRGTSLANPALQPTTARSWSTGMVWSPGEHLSLSVDYLDMLIRDEVVEQDIDQLVQADASCLLGRLDPGSAYCQELTNPTDGRVQRAGRDGPVTALRTTYANLSSETVHAVFAALRYRFAPSPLGRVDLQLDYNDLLQHDFRLAAGSPAVRQLAQPQSSTEFKSVVTGALDWRSPGQRWNATVYARRFGASPSYAAILGGAGQPGAGRLHPWITVNTSVGLRVSRRLALALNVTNLANKMPPRDPSYVAPPYFNDENYDIYGRRVMLQLRMNFDAR